jgi:hypothetical protein
MASRLLADGMDHHALPSAQRGGGMAARYRSGYLVSRRRGALSHAKALATGERLHLEWVHIPKLIFCPCPSTSPNSFSVPVRPHPQTHFLSLSNTSLSFFIAIGVRRADYIYLLFWPIDESRMLLSGIGDCVVCHCLVR